MLSRKVQYIIKSVPVDDKQALENLLNNMSEEGWDLYTMHEVESDDTIEFNCIFSKEKREENKTDLDDLVNVASFKTRMEKMLATPTSPYESCKEIQLKISSQKDRIKRIKAELENENLSLDEKNRLNTQMSDELNLLKDLKKSLTSEISPENLYTLIKEEKFVLNLSEELLELVDLEYNNGILSETVKVRQELAGSLGYVLPHIYFHNDDELNQNEFAIKIHDVEVFRGLAFANYVAFYKDDLKNYKISDDDIIAIDSMTERKMIWIHQDKTRDFWVNGLSAAEYIAKVVEFVSIKEVADILDYNDINSFLEIVIENNSFLVDNIIPEYITIADLKYLLTSLLRERVSIKNITYLFEKINDYANEPTKEDLLDKVRLAFSKLIIKDLANDGELKVIEFSDATLELVDGFFNSSDDENIIRIEASEVEKIADKINRIVKSKKIETPILVVPMDLRHMCFIILSEFVPNIRVIACEELVSDCNIKFIGKV